MRRRFITVLAALVLLPILLGANPSWSSAESPPALVTGHLVRQGDPAADAEVRVSLFPVIPERGLTRGRLVQPQLLPPVLTGRDGSFVVALPSPDELRGYVDRWGRLDVTITVEDDTTITQYRESTELPSPETSTPDLRLDLDSGVLVETLGADTPARHRLPLESVSEVSQRQTDAALHPCEATAGKKYLGRRERFMFVNNWVGAKATVLQLSGTSHTLGVATKVAGKAWSANHSSSRTIATTNHARQHGVVDRWVRNRVNYQDIHYRGLCDYPGEHTDRVAISIHTLISDLRLRPTLPDLRDPFDCAPHRRGYEYTKDETSNRTIERGVDLGSVKVSALSGWTDETAWTVYVTKRSKECWSNEQGPEHSRYVQYSQARRREPCGRMARCRPAAHDRVH